MLYQETTNEDAEDFMCAAVTVVFRVCKPVRLLQLLVVTSCVYKCAINLVTNPNPYIVTQSRENIVLFRIMTQCCNLIGGYQYFIRKRCLYLRG
jgi:hypothetical protein